MRIHFEASNEMYISANKPVFKIALCPDEEVLFVTTGDKSPKWITWTVGMLAPISFKNLLDRVAPAASLLLDKDKLATEKAEIYASIAAIAREYQYDEVPWAFAHDYFGTDLDWVIRRLLWRRIPPREIANRLLILFYPDGTDESPYIYGMLDHVLYRRAQWQLL